MIDRREFLKAGTLAAAGSALTRAESLQTTGSVQRITIQIKAPGSSKVRLAETEIVSGLKALQVAGEVAMVDEAPREQGRLHCVLTIEPNRFKGKEEYEIRTAGQEVTLSAVNEQSLLYAVFEFLEKQGLVFGIDGATAPIDRPAGLSLPQPSQPWTASPCLPCAGFCPGPIFSTASASITTRISKRTSLRCCACASTCSACTSIRRTSPGRWRNPTCPIDFAGSGHRAALEDTTMTSWGYLPQRTSTFKMGAAQFFDAETFGADATRLAADNWDIATRTTAMMRAAFIVRRRARHSHRHRL